VDVLTVLLAVDDSSYSSIAVSSSRAGKGMKTIVSLSVFINSISCVMCIRRIGRVQHINAAAAIMR